MFEKSIINIENNFETSIINIKNNFETSLINIENNFETSIINKVNSNLILWNVHNGDIIKTEDSVSYNFEI